MNPPNGKTNGSAINEVNGQSSVPPVALAAVSSPPQCFSAPSAAKRVLFLQLVLGTHRSYANPQVLTIPRS